MGGSSSRAAVGVAEAQILRPSMVSQARILVRYRCTIGLAWRRSGWPPRISQISDSQRTHQPDRREQRAQHREPRNPLNRRVMC
jgi:hypothetical protein